QNAMKSFLYSFFMRRRKTIRRREDLEASVYVDVHDTGTVVLFTSVILMCVIDAIFTMFIMNHGGEEINPFMNYLIAKDVMTFFWVKFSLTSFGMLFLVSHKYFVFYRVLKGLHVIKIIFSMYFILVAYEISIIYTIAERSVI
ncbi:MAG: DUF5658 family protein, partial [Gammaproteobacteria bacterium]|nr:DUF5658 family protein [Gammaproteobacteria bacterium]